jgi:hypothetical protein
MELNEFVGEEDDNWIVVGRLDWDAVAQNCLSLALAMKNSGDFSILAYMNWNKDHSPV